MPKVTVRVAVDKSYKFTTEISDEQAQAIDNGSSPQDIITIPAIGEMELVDDGFESIYAVETEEGDTIYEH